MADEEFNVLRDLQTHLRTAQVPFEQLSTLAKQGDDKHWALDKQDLQLVERFLTENIRVEGSGPEVMQSQLYIACFWGIRDIVMALLAKGCDPNCQNKGTLWTPLHAASFQEHGPIVMVLLEKGAQPELPDSEGRTAKDFASASDKIWPHFAMLGLSRSRKPELIQKGVIKKVQETGSNNRPAYKAPGQGIRMMSAVLGFELADISDLAADSRPESAYAYNSDPFIHAAVTGDVLADQQESQQPQSSSQPQFTLWR